jgi:class 3 adenylate cyclase
MGLHTGVAEPRGRDYFGPTVNRTARLMAVGHGGQVLLSAAAAALIVDQLPDVATLRDLGEHRLKDLGRPERVFQLVHAGVQSDFPPLKTPSRASAGAGFSSAYRPNCLRRAEGQKR